MSALTFRSTFYEVYVAAKGRSRILLTAHYDKKPALVSADDAKSRWDEVWLYKTVTGVTLLDHKEPA